MGLQNFLLLVWPVVAFSLNASTSSEYHYVFQDPKIKYCHMTTIEVVSGGTFAVAWQSSPEHEGATDQSFRFKTSPDGGNTWTVSKVLPFGPPEGEPAVWGPTLFYNEQNSTLSMIYSQSVPENVRWHGYWPGGDIRITHSMDSGATWTKPQTLLKYNDPTRGLVSKVTANKPIKLQSGRLMLPFWQEPHTKDETGPKCAGLLVSDDGGLSWTPRACLKIDGTWLIENTVAQFQSGSILQLFRTSVGYIYQSVSNDDGETWSTPKATDIPNPNSKTYLVSVPGTDRAVIACNPIKNGRNVLGLFETKDAGKTWSPLATLEDEVVSDYPTAMIYKNRVYTTYSADGHKNVKLAITDL